MKKNYSEPSMRMAGVQIRCSLLVGSDVNKASSNTGMDENITGGNGVGRARQRLSFDL